MVWIYETSDLDLWSGIESRAVYAQLMYARVTRPLLAQGLIQGSGYGSPGRDDKRGNGK